MKKGESGQELDSRIYNTSEKSGGFLPRYFMILGVWDITSLNQTVCHSGFHCSPIAEKENIVHYWFLYCWMFLLHLLLALILFV